MWEACAQVTKRIPQTQRIRSVAREGKRKFEFLGVTDAEEREHRGNPAGNAGMNSKRAGWWKPIKCILCTHTAAVVLRTFVSSCTARRAPTDTCLRLALPFYNTLRSISMRVYRFRGGGLQKLRNAWVHEDSCRQHSCCLLTLRVCQRLCVCVQCNIIHVSHIFLRALYRAIKCHSAWNTKKKLEKLSFIRPKISIAIPSLSHE